MSFFAILLALLLEQARPLGRGNFLHASARQWVQWVSRNLDAGRVTQGGLVWTVAVGVPALAATLMHWVLVWTLGWVVATLWSVLVLYATLGFRQFSHHFTNIRDALELGDEASARELLAQWQQVDAGALPRSEIVRHVIEYSVLAAHRHVFGVLACYAMGSALGLGPAGAVLYRLSEFVARYWVTPARPGLCMVSAAVSETAVRAWVWLDYLPARMTALGFAVVGSFEDAIDGWRNHAQLFPDDNDGVILAATSGAINVRLGGRALRSPGGEDPQHPADATSTPGQPPELAHLRIIVGLVWRSVVMWMVMLALLTLARLLG
jgi:adenosylcobinamide-phosphate synthase